MLHGDRETSMVAQWIFNGFAALLLLAACGVVFGRNSVRAALCLILTFLCAAPLWLMAKAEFLALVLVFVYVGAVMTLFLFVVMMLDIKATERRSGWVRHYPLVALTVGMLALLLMGLLKTGFTKNGLFLG